MPLSSPLRAALRRGTLLGLLAGVVACGGGDGGGSTATWLDANRYSTDRNASLATPNEIVATTHASVTVGGSAIAYTVTAGHLSALDGGGAPEASFFHVDYTADGAAAATRPVTFFFNGGPGSATAWLHLGSFAPKRLVTGVPATALSAPFAYVDNAESLIDTSDLVFVDAIGTGLSEAIAPHTNQSFWGVDVDAAAFRDFVARWLAVNGRTASPLFLYGESYGTVRAPVLARLLETAGVPVAGVVLQSSILDYNSNCSIVLPPAVGCAGFLPTYAAVGAWFGLVEPVPADLPTFLSQMRAYADATYAPETAQWLALGSPANPPPGADVATLVADTGLDAATWNRQFDMDYDTFRHALVAGQVLGVYDGRMSAAVGSALAAQDDPSNSYIEAPFTQAINALLPQLGYTNPTTYAMFSSANVYWDFSHDGRALPDVVPDLATALSLDARLKVLSVGGEHDLITPFHQTELDTARLGAGAPLTNLFHEGGHMTYLDDGSRPLMKADLQAFYAAVAGAR